MKNILFILYFIIYSCTPAFGAATTTITADSIRSSNRTKTWTPPSITDVLTGLTDVQTLTNKTLTSPTINTPLVDVDTFTEQGSTPSTPAAGKRKVYAKADGIYHLDSAGNERKVGSGSGGGDVSYITNGNADDANASIFVPYADAAATRPVDGTGGSPTVTTSITSTVPLVGTKSYLLTKPASNVQGQGWAIPFTVDLGYRAKASKITVQYIVNSGTFVAGSDSTESDVIWYLYDVTNSALIEPSNIKMRASSTTISDQYEAEFQTSATGSSYRLIAHVQSTSALAYELKVDEIKVSPNKAIYGTTGSDWQAYTPTFTNFGTVTGASFTWRRVGSSAEIRGVFTTGTTVAAEARISLPSGLTSASNLPTLSKVGDMGNSAAEAASFQVNIEPSITYLTMGKQSAGAAGFAKGSGNSWTSSTAYSLVASVPIQGWSSSVQMSDQTDTRVVALRANKNGTQSATNASEVVVTGWTTLKDTHGSFNGTTGVYTVSVPGQYLLSGLITFAANTTGLRYAAIYKNGSINTLGGQIPPAPGGDSGATFSAIIDCVAGDTLSIAGFQNSGGALNITTGTNLSIFKISGPSAIAASESVNAVYTTAAGQSIPNATDTIIDFGTAEINSHGNVTTGAAWKFTAQTSGVYEVSAFVQLNSGGGWGVGEEALITLFKNGSSFARMGINITTVAHTNSVAVQCVPRQIRLLAGDFIDIRLNQNSGAAISLVATASINWVSIKRIGN